MVGTTQTAFGEKIMLEVLGDLDCYQAIDQLPDHLKDYACLLAYTGLLAWQNSDDPIGKVYANLEISIINMSKFGFSDHDIRLITEAIGYQDAFVFPFIG